MYPTHMHVSGMHQILVNEPQTSLLFSSFDKNKSFHPKIWNIVKNKLSRIEKWIELEMKIKKIK